MGTPLTDLRPAGNEPRLPKAQNNTHSGAGRSDRIFREVAAQAFADPPASILSFGCSVGHECLSLKALFPGAAVHGCDIDDAALAEARERCGPRAEIFTSSEAEIRRRGPFDLVTAMSVLCRYPATQELEDISTAFPFALYDALLGTIAEAVAPGGVLVLYNAQYLMEESSVAHLFEPIATPNLPANGFCNRHRKDGSRCTDVAYLTLDGSIIPREEGLARLRAARRDGLRQSDVGIGSTIIGREPGPPGSLRTVAWRKR